MMVGSAGFMAPEQISGRPGPAADIFVWGVTVAYAATGQPPFGTGDTHAILYRVIHDDPDIGGVPQPLRPLVAAALAKDPARRPTARQLLDQLTTAARSPRGPDSPAQTVLATTWPRTGLPPGGPGVSREARGAEGSLLLDPAWPGPMPPGPGPPGPGPPGPRRRRTAKGRVSRRTKTAVAAA